MEITQSTLTHDPIAATNQLAAKLASHSRHVCFLFGAGTSCAAGLPDVTRLLKDVLASLDDDELKNPAARLYQGRNLEEGLTRLRRIRALLTDEDTFGGLDVKGAEDLERAITSAIVTRLSDGNLDRTAAAGFATWAAGDYYKRPIEVFTVNPGLS